MKNLKTIAKLWLKIINNQTFQKAIIALVDHALGVFFSITKATEDKLTGPNAWRIAGLSKELETNEEVNKELKAIQDNMVAVRTSFMKIVEITEKEAKERFQDCEELETFIEMINKELEGFEKVGETFTAELKTDKELMFNIDIFDDLV